MRVTVFGGTGFVGNYLVDELLAQGHHPVLLVRPGSQDRKKPGHIAVQIGFLKDFPSKYFHRTTQVVKVGTGDFVGKYIKN